MRPRGSVLNRLRHGVGLGPDHVGSQVPAVRPQRERDSPGDANQVLVFEGPIAAAVADTTTSHVVAPVGQHLALEALDDVAVATIAKDRAGEVAVAEVEPERPGVLEHPPQMPEDVQEVLDVELGRRFQAQAAEPGAAEQAGGAAVAGCPTPDGDHGETAGALRRRSTMRVASSAAPPVPAVGIAAPHDGRQVVVAEAPVLRRRDAAVNAVVRKRGQDLTGVAHVHHGAAALVGGGRAQARSGRP